MIQHLASKRRRFASMAVILALTSAPIAHAQECTTNGETLRSKISAVQKQAQDAYSTIQNEFGKSTSSSYSKEYFKRFENYNSGAKEATQLINKGYEIANFVKPMAEGTVRTTMPPLVTNTMSNAVELAQAALDEENSKLDVAQLRCDQSTEDTALSSYLAQADSGTVSTFKSAKYNACKAVHILADLQDKREKLNDFRKNGYPLFFLHGKEKKSFAGRKRTIQLKIDLRMYPEYPSKPVNVDRKGQPILLGQIKGIDLSYNSYFKWSDNNWTTLNLYQYIVDEHDQGEICAPKFSITSSVKAKLCTRVESISDDKTQITLKSRAKFKYKGEWHGVSLGSRKVYAPFGYLADLSDRKEKKMDELQSKVAKRLASLLGDYGEMIEEAKKWQGSCAS